MASLDDFGSRKKHLRIQLCFAMFLLGCFCSYRMTSLYYEIKINQINFEYEKQINKLKNLHDDFDDDEYYQLLRKEMRKNSIATQRSDAKTLRIKQLALQVASLQDYLILLNESCK